MMSFEMRCECREQQQPKDYVACTCVEQGQAVHVYSADGVALAVLERASGCILEASNVVSSRCVAVGRKI